MRTLLNYSDEARRVRYQILCCHNWKREGLQALCRITIIHDNRGAWDIKLWSVQTL